MAEWTAKHCEGLIYKVLDGEGHLVAWTNSEHSSLIAMAPRMEALIRKASLKHNTKQPCGFEGCEPCEARAILSEIDQGRS
jgi:hypothetical protein